LWRGGKESSSPAHRRKQHHLLVHLWPLPSQGFGCLLAVVSLYKPQSRGPSSAGPMDWDSAFTSQLGCISGSHFHTLSHSTVLPPCSLNLRDMVSPQKVVTRVSLLGVNHSPILPPEVGLNLNPSSYQSVKVRFPSWLLSLSRFLCVTETCFPSLLGERLPVPRSTGLVMPGRGGLLLGWGC
jgi:hypothetical protein